MEEQMLIVMDKSVHEEYLFQPLQTNIKQFEIAATFISAYNGMLNVTNLNKKFYFKKALIHEDFIQITNLSQFSTGSRRRYEIESLNNELRRVIIHEGHYTAVDYPCKIKPNFNTLGSIIEIHPQGPILAFVFDNSMSNLVGFNETLLYEKYNSSDYPVDILSFDNIFIQCDVAKGMIFL